MQYNIFWPTKGKGNRFQYYAFYKQWQKKDKYIVRNNCDCESKFDLEIYTKPFPCYLQQIIKHFIKTYFVLAYQG